MPKNVQTKSPEGSDHIYRMSSLLVRTTQTRKRLLQLSQVSAMLLAPQVGTSDRADNNSRCQACGSSHPVKKIGRTVAEDVHHTMSQWQLTRHLVNDAALSLSLLDVFSTAHGQVKYNYHKGNFADIQSSLQLVNWEER